MTLVVLAAGMGSRYGGLKQMDPVTEHGEFIIDFSVYDAIRAGYDKVVFIIKPQIYDAFRETIGARIEKEIRVEYVFQTLENNITDWYTVLPERTKPFGTAHALLSCKDVVDEPFAVINADDYYGVDAFRLVKEYMEAEKPSGKAHFCMAGYRLGNTLTENGTVSRGICEKNEEDFLVSITERTKIKHNDAMNGAEFEEDGVWSPLSYDSIASMNFFGFTPDIITHIVDGFPAFLNDSATNHLKGEYYLPKAVDEMLKSGASDLKVLDTPDRWFGVTYPEDKAYVVNSIKEKIESGIYPDGLWK